jgi:hypothetical protein
LRKKDSDTVDKNIIIMNYYKISIFPTKSSNGIDLAKGIKDLILSSKGMLETQYIRDTKLIDYRSMIFDKNKIEIKFYNRNIKDVNQVDFLEACLNDDLVIFDATREGSNNKINNFDIANEHPKSLEHIWIVSRNYLPINFYGVDTGGYPDYKTEIKSNSEILEWIEKKLSYIDFSQPRDIAEKGMRGWHKSSDRTKEKDFEQKNEQTNVFISFRTQYEFKRTITLRRDSYEKLTRILPLETYKKTIKLSNKSFNTETNAFEEALKNILTKDEYIHIASIQDNALTISLKEINSKYHYSVEEIAERIRKGLYHNSTSKSVKYLEDGNLVYSTELNTKQRTWQLLSIIDRDYLMHCDELWIYGSDDYLNSWWTIGELIIYSFLLQQNIDKRKNKPPRKLIFYNPKEDSVKEIEAFKINEQIAQRIIRIQSNCAPSVMGFESVKSLRMMRNILYENNEQHNKSLDEYLDILIKSILPMSLKEQGMDEDTIEQILNDEDSKEEIKNMLIPQLELMKEQVQSGNLSNELRTYYKQVLEMQNQQLPKDLQNIITEDDLIKTGLSEEYLKDHVFSEDLWETVVSQIPQNDRIDEDCLAEKIKKIDISQIENHLEFKYPSHRTLGNIQLLEKELISEVDGKNLIKKPSRFIFMPTRVSCVELSPTHNNLLEMPVFVIEE